MSEEECKERNWNDGGIRLASEKDDFRKEGIDTIVNYYIQKSGENYHLKTDYSLVGSPTIIRSDEATLDLRDLTRTLLCELYRVNVVYGFSYSGPLFTLDLVEGIINLKNQKNSLQRKISGIGKYVTQIIEEEKLK